MWSVKLLCIVCQNYMEYLIVKTMCVQGGTWRWFRRLKLHDIDPVQLSSKCVLYSDTDGICSATPWWYFSDQIFTRSDLIYLHNVSFLCKNWQHRDIDKEVTIWQQALMCSRLTYWVTQLNSLCENLGPPPMYL